MLILLAICVVAFLLYRAYVNHVNGASGIAVPVNTTEPRGAVPAIPQQRAACAACAGTGAGWRERPPERLHWANSYQETWDLEERSCGQCGGTGTVRAVDR